MPAIRLLAGSRSDDRRQGLYSLVDTLGCEPSVAEQQPSLGPAIQQHRRQGSDPDPVSRGVAGHGDIVDAIR
jgi:hypothetical protein